MAESGSSRLVLVVGAESMLTGVADGLETATGYRVKTESDERSARDRLSWPDVDAVVGVHDPDAFDANAFLDSVAETNPTMPVYAVGDAEDGLTGGSQTWYNTAEIDRLGANIAGRLDERDARRTLDRFDSGGAAAYPNVDSEDVDELIRGEIDRETAAELLHKQQLIDSIFGTVPAHLFVKDIDGRHRYVSERYFDEHPEEFLDRADPEIPHVAPDHAWRAFEDDMHVIETGDPILNKEEYLPALDKWNDTSKVPWYHDGDIVGLLGVTHEVTERKERRREVEWQNDRLEQFAELVSHDLRNPLQVAQSAIELAQAENDTGRLDTAQQALTRMNTIIEDVLLLAKFGRAVVDPEPLDLRLCATQAWGTVESIGSELTVSEELAPILGDKGYVQQLLENLCRNAIEHGSTEQASVHVRIGPLRDGTEQVGFYVEDDGPGIPADEREAVFETGYTTASDGTGFGLSIVSEIAQAHGWSVSITDGSEGGVRFEVRGVEACE